MNGFILIIAGLCFVYVGSLLDSNDHQGYNYRFGGWCAVIFGFGYMFTMFT